MFNSAELAAEEMGEINGEEIEVVTENTAAQPDQARSAYQNLTTGEDVDATVGVFNSESLVTILEQMPDTQTLHLGSGAATPEATSRIADNYEDFKYFFRAGPTNAVFLGETMVDFAEDYFDSMGWDSVALMMEDFAWTQLVQGTLDESLEEATGVDIVYSERIAGGTNDYTPIFDEIENSGADGAYTAIANIGTEPLLQWANQQPQFGFGGINVPSQIPSLWEQTSGACQYVFTQTAATAQSEVTEKTVPYAEAYQEMFDGLPVYTGYHTYDAMYMYKEAVEEAGTFDTDEVISTLEDISFTGTVGTIEFFGQDETYPHDVKPGEELFTGVYFQWQESDDGGAQEPLWPSDVATTEYQQPSWIQ